MTVSTVRDSGACGVILYFTIVTIEGACTWEPNVLSREQEKWLKYAEMAEDLRVQYPQCEVLIGCTCCSGDLRSGK
ncbi:MAG: hypothetical protein K0U02_06080 [Betaproteobacteria bacterium]|nr:hypothetical protein [Betaproteobacteria bacterium]